MEEGTEQVQIADNKEDRPVHLEITVKDSDKYKWQTAYKKRKLRESVEFRKKAAAMTKAWQRRKYAEDPEYRERIRGQQRKYYQERKQRTAQSTDQQETREH